MDNVLDAVLWVEAADNAPLRPPPTSGRLGRTVSPLPPSALRRRASTAGTVNREGAAVPMRGWPRPTAPAPLSRAPAQRDPPTRSTEGTSAFRALAAAAAAAAAATTPPAAAATPPAAVPTRTAASLPTKETKAKVAPRRVPPVEYTSSSGDSPVGRPTAPPAGAATVSRRAEAAHRRRAEDLRRFRGQDGRFVPKRAGGPGGIGGGGYGPGGDGAAAGGASGGGGDQSTGWLDRRCDSCGTTTTAQWRYGGNDEQMLCNGTSSR